MSSPLMDPTSVQKICNLTDGAGIVYSGMGPDFRVLVKKGRKAAQQYFRVYQVCGPLRLPRPPSLRSSTPPEPCPAPARAADADVCACTGVHAALAAVAGACDHDAGVHAAGVRTAACACPARAWTAPLLSRRLSLTRLALLQWRAAVRCFAAGCWL